MINSKKFSEENANHYLTQAYEESRYFRNLSNLMFHIFLTIYIGLLIAQINYTLDVYVKIFFLFFLLISFLFVSHLLLRYHNMHGGWQEKLYILKKEYLSYPDNFIENKHYDGFENKCPLIKAIIGKGQIELIGYLAFLVIINVLLIFYKAKIASTLMKVLISTIFYINSF